MAIKVKKGGVYADPVGIFAKKAGVYSAVTGVSAKVAGAYVSVGGTPVLQRAVASRLLAPPQEIQAAYPYFKAKTWHKLFDAVNGQIEIWWPNFYTATGGGAPGGGCSDRAPGAAATAVASITYTDVGTGLPATVNLLDKTGGTAALTAANGGWFKAVATINAAAGSVIYPKIYGNNPNGCFYSLAKADPANGDLFQFQAGAMALAGDPVPTFPSFRTWYGPCLIAASSTKAVMAIIGDSRDDGLKDMASDATGNIGVFMRTFGATVACVNLSGRGDMAQSFASATHSARRRELLPFATFKGLGHGINDINSASRTAAQVMADQATIAAIDANPVIYRTQNPFTTGGIVTPWDVTKEVQRQGYNTLVRATSVYFDPDAVLSTGGSGGWLNEDAVNIDYLHETAVGNAYAATNGALVGTSVGVHGIAARAAGAAMPGWGTNLFTFNRDPSNASWAKNDTTIVTAQPDAECGSSAQKVQEAATTASHSLAKGPISVTAGTYEVWMDVGPGGRDWFFYQIIDSNLGFANQVLKWFNASTAATGNTFVTVGGESNLNFVSSSVTPIAGSAGFNRYKMTFTVGAAVTGIFISAKLDTGNGADASYLGDITKGIVARPQMWLRQTVVAPVPDTFDPANKDASVTLSESNLRMTSAASDRGVKSVQSRSSGKLYFEIEMVGSAAGTLGLANASQATNAWVGSSGNSRGFDTATGGSGSGGSITGPTGVGALGSTNVLNISVDFPAGKVWFAKNGVLGSGQDPVAGTGGFSIPAGALFIMASGGNTASFRLRTTAAQFQSAPPTGFTAWVP